MKNNIIFILIIGLFMLIPSVYASQVLGDSYNDNVAASLPIGHPTADWKECGFWRPENISSTDKITNIGLYIKKNNAGARGTKIWIEIFTASNGTNIAVPVNNRIKSLTNITIGSLPTAYTWMNWSMPNTTLGTPSKSNYTVCVYSNMTSATVTTWGVFETGVYPEPSQTVDKASSSWAEYYTNHIFRMKIYKDNTPAGGDSCTYSGTGNFIITKNCNITSIVHLQVGYAMLIKTGKTVKFQSGGSLI